MGGDGASLPFYKLFWPIPFNLVALRFGINKQKRSLFFTQQHSPTWAAIVFPIQFVGIKHVNYIYFQITFYVQHHPVTRIWAEKKCIEPFEPHIKLITR